MPNALQDWIYRSFYDDTAQAKKAARTSDSGGIHPGIMDPRSVQPEPKVPPEVFYDQNPWFYIAVKRCADALAGLPVRVFIKRPDGELVDKGPGIENAQRLIDRPNDYQTSFAFFRHVASWLKIRGQAFIYLDFVFDGVQALETKPPLGPPVFLHVLPPVYVEIVPDDELYVSHYKVRINGRMIPVHKDRIVTITEFSGQYEHGGLGSGEALKSVLHLENYQTWYNTQGFKHGGSHQRLYAETDKQMNDRLRDKIQRWLTRKLTGRNAWEPIVSSSGMKIRMAGTTHREMEFIDMHKLNREAIMGACGVGPARGGILEDANRSNMEEQDRVFWESECLPMKANIEGTVSMKLLPRFGDNLVLQFDVSGIGVLQENLDALLTMAATMIDKRIASPNTAIEWLNSRGVQVLEPYEGGDVILVPMSLIPLEDMLEPPDEGGDQEGDAPQPPGDPAEEDQPQDGDAPPEDDQADEEKAATTTEWFQRAWDDAEIADVWRTLRHREPLTTRQRDVFKATNERRQMALARRFRRVYLVPLLNKWRDEIIERMKHLDTDVMGPDVAASLRAAMERADWPMYGPPYTVEGILFETRAAAEAEAITRTRAFHKRTIFSRAQEVLDSLGVIAETDLVLTQAVATFIQEKPKIFAGSWTKTVMDRISRNLIDVLESGEATIGKLQTAVRGVMKAESAARALTVARTEALPAFNFGAEIGYAASGVVEGREWLSADDDVVRDLHVEMDGEIMPLGEPFHFTNGDDLMYPGDPSGSPGNIINCRCNTAPILKPEQSDGRGNRKGDGRQDQKLRS